MTTWEECGCCGGEHPRGFDGDCRDDNNRRYALSGRTIADIMGKNYRNEIDFDETVKLLAREWSAFELAYFIVDAKNRGWITNFNVGLNDEGYRI